MKICKVEMILLDGVLYNNNNIVLPMKINFVSNRLILIHNVHQDYKNMKILQNVKIILP